MNHHDYFSLETLSVRAGQERSQFGEHSEGMYLTSSFIFDSAASAAARFANAEAGMVYARYTNPTVGMLQDRLAALENAERCVAFSSGMAAILATAMSFLRSGDHVIVSNGVFGSTQQLFGPNVLSRFGVETSYVPATRIESYRAAVRTNTKMIFVETPSNPLTEIVDIERVSEIAHSASALMVVDNSFCSPALQRPLDLGADLVVHSATKYLDGQGRVLGGAICGNKSLLEEALRFLRTTGSTLSAFNAWVILKGIETLPIRMAAQSLSALEVSKWLELQPNVQRVFYPGLPSHPQFELARRQQKSGGAVVSFEVKGGREAAWRVIDRCRMLSITANLGDTKTTITHPASTTHGRLSPEGRLEAGITEGLIRLAIGLESVDDIKLDLSTGLA